MPSKKLAWRWLLTFYTLAQSCKGLVCPSRQLDWIERGRMCPPPCITRGNCTFPRLCKCDDNCGMTCYNPLATCRIGGTLEPVNGHVDKPPKRLTQGVKVWFHCNTGHRLSHRDGRTCRSDGKWSGSTPVCIPVLCLSLPQPENGYMTPSMQVQWPFGSVVTYNCYQGFVLKSFSADESTTRRCTEDQTWSGTAPKCVASESDNNECPDPSGCSKDGYCASLPNIENGWIEISREQDSFKWPQPRVMTSKSGVYHRNTTSVFFPPDEVLVYSCNNGYRLVGGSDRRACVDGKWTGIQPSCNVSYLSDCWPPEKCYKTSGTSEIAFRTGYTELQPPPNWPACLKNDSCEWGERDQISGRNFWTSLENFLIPFIRTFFVCPYPSVLYGIQPKPWETIKGAWKHGESFTVKCMPGYMLSNQSQTTMTCMDGVKWEPSPTGVCTGCVKPVVRNGKPARWKVITRWPIGGTFSARCYEGFKPPRPNLSTCLAGLVWKKPILKCVKTEPWKVYCDYPYVQYGWAVSPYVFSFIKRLFVRHRWVPGDVALYKCHPSFKIVSGNRRRTCLKNGTWSGRQPICKWYCRENIILKWLGLSNKCKNKKS